MPDELRDQDAELRFRVRQAASSDRVATPTIRESQKKSPVSRGIFQKNSGLHGCVGMLGARATGGVDDPSG
jgi:hypothetical protein